MIAYVDPGSAEQRTAPQLERLDERALLFLVTAEHDLAYAVASIRDGTTTPHRHDITELLPRLGCTGVAALRAWCLSPRVLTPTDVDVLCYALQLPLPGEAPPPRPLIVHARAEVLLRAIHANPASDDERLVYADVLQEEDDPHGELIALQLARARTGGEPTPHERALVQWYGSAIAAPLTPYLRFGYELRRGFLGACAVDTEVPAAVLDSPAWSTVESIESTVLTVLTNPRLVARRCVTDGATLARLVEARRELPFETIVGRHHGANLAAPILITDQAWWRALHRVGALTRLRALQLASTRDQSSNATDLIASPLGAQLDQLEICVGPDGANFGAWRRAFDTARLARLVVRHPARVRSHVHDARFALERGSPHVLTLVLDGHVGAHHHDEIVGTLAALGRDQTRLGIATRGARLTEELERRLRERFAEPVACDPPRLGALGE